MLFKKPNLEIITSKDKWRKTLDEVGLYDFYHTFDYHMLEKSEDKHPVLLQYTEGAVCIALPLIIRKIKNTEYFDATSVYGYAGPISKNIGKDFSNILFIEQLQKYFKENKIISVFSRLHPYLSNQKFILNNYGKIINQGKVVNIDVLLDLNSQKRNYQQRLRTYINKARRNCEVKKLESHAELKEFIDIYHQNMSRLNAKEEYFFDEDYFLSLLNGKQFKAEILLVRDLKSKNIVAGSLFVTTFNIVQYHLSGTKFEFLHLTPIKLLIDEMRTIATKRGLKFYNLGGGLGASSNDSLFRFKSTFSKDFRDFNTWNVVVNQTVYDSLVNKQELVENSFFPEYRSSSQSY